MNKRLRGSGFATRLGVGERLQAEELIESQAEAHGEAHMEEIPPRGPAKMRGIIIPGSGDGFGHDTISCV